MTRITLEDRFITYVRNAIDMTVDNTGFPVLGKHLSEAGIASKKQLKILESKGMVQAISIKSDQGTVYKAYYTERHVPEWVKEQEELRKEKEQSKGIILTES